jgi:hypothetical protein
MKTRLSLNTGRWAVLLLVLAVAVENPTAAQNSAIPSLDELAGTWQQASALRSLPAINSTQGSAQAVNDLLAIGKLSYPPVTMTGTTGALFINGKKPTVDETRWYPYQVLRKGSSGNIGIETAVRMLYERRGVAFRIVLTNTSAAEKSIDVKIDLTAYISRHSRWGWKVPRTADSSSFLASRMEAPGSLLLRDERAQLSTCYSFSDEPNELLVNGHSGQAVWKTTLPPKGKRVIRYVLAFGENDREVHDLAATSAGHFDDAFRQVKNDWETRWQAMFTPGNKYFSGNVPVLRTSDKAMRRIYYMSVVSLLSVYRTSFPLAPRVYVSNSPESNCTMMYFWDTREWATTLALLDPVMLKEHLRSWLSKDVYTGYAEEYLTGTLQGVWYSANDYSIFILLNDYLNVSGDRNFLSERINNKTILEHLDSLATHWKSLVRPGRTLADYGGTDNLLECVPTYINEIASFNAANVGIMRRVAALHEAAGNAARAKELRAESDTLLRAVLELYVPGEGVWDARHNDGKRVPTRHVFDYATIGLTIPGELTPTMQTEMTRFAERELLTDHWMRAQSRTDPAAGVSDRPDHGPMGAYCAWPPETMAAMCEFGQFDKALNFLHRCEDVTYEGPFSQSRELMDTTFHAPVKINERGTGGFPTQTYNASNGGGFAETIIRGFFGYQPDFITGTLIPAARARGFNGELLNVRQGDRRYNIFSGGKGIRIQPAK